ncbi:hypothetical protein H4R35_000462 [Dimargaris xerosporica]|nr:hypothetical protein H4R35_000462 [Dimargaris xerosporica]
MPVRWVRQTRRMAWLGAAAAGIYTYDRCYQASSLTRTARTLAATALIIADYKWNFQPDKADRINQLHTRVARRILDVCEQNGGLYIKFGQAVALYSTVLPPQYNTIFKVLYDRAPEVALAEIDRVIQREFGCGPDELFDTFDRTPLASASVAQVHRARLKQSLLGDQPGPWVAVKVQKPAIAQQIEWDLAVLKLVVWALERAFDLPLAWPLEYSMRHVRQEVDFVNEAHNAELADSLLAQDPTLRETVYIPKVYWRYTCPTVMTAEWIDGQSLTNLDATQLPPYCEPAALMDAIVSLFANQIFVNGFVHCDPHPGNILLRPHPENPRRFQVVLIDHGLYVRATDEFRQQNCQFWKALFLMDTTAIRDICEAWGVGDADLLASLTLLRPFSSRQPAGLLHHEPQVSQRALYEMQLAIKARARNFLTNTDQFPKAFIFVGRNMNMVRALNKAMGSPVNRVTIMANYAARGLGTNWQAWSQHTLAGHPKAPQDLSLGAWLCQPRQSLATLLDWLRFLIRSRVSYYMFRLSLWALSAHFYLHRAWAALQRCCTTHEVGNFEQLMEDSAAQAFEQQFGYTMDTSLLEA